MLALIFNLFTSFLIFLYTSRTDRNDSLLFTFADRNSEKLANGENVKRELIGILICAMCVCDVCWLFSSHTVQCGEEGAAC